MNQPIDQTNQPLPEDQRSALPELGAMPSTKEADLFVVKRISGKKRFKYYISNIRRDFANLLRKLHEHVELDPWYPLPEVPTHPGSVYTFIFSDTIETPVILAKPSITSKQGYILEVRWPVNYDETHYRGDLGVRVHIPKDCNRQTNALTIMPAPFNPSNGLTRENAFGDPDQVWNVLKALADPDKTSGGGVVHAALHRRLFGPSPIMEARTPVDEDNPLIKFKATIITTGDPGGAAAYQLIIRTDKVDVSLMAPAPDGITPPTEFVSTRGFTIRAPFDAQPHAAFHLKDNRLVGYYPGADQVIPPTRKYEESDSVNLVLDYNDLVHALNEWKAVNYQYVDLRKSKSLITLPPKVTNWE